jgi:hypothetical protein
MQSRDFQHLSRFRQDCRSSRTMNRIQQIVHACRGISRRTFAVYGIIVFPHRWQRQSALAVMRKKFVLVRAKRNAV